MNRKKKEKKKKKKKEEIIAILIWMQVVLALSVCGWLILVCAFQKETDTDFYAHEYNMFIFITILVLQKGGTQNSVHATKILFL